MLSAECTEPRLKLVVLTHPWTKLDTEVRVAPDIASCRWKKGGKNNKTTTTPYCKYAGAGGKQGLEVGRGKIIDGLSWPVVPAKVTLARDQQSLCHWLILSPTQHPYWDTMTVLLLSFINVAMETIAFFMQHPKVILQKVMDFKNQLKETSNLFSMTWYIIL